MVVTCTGCNARYRLDLNKVKTSRALLQCPKCGRRFTVSVTEEDRLRDALRAAPPPAPERKPREPLYFPDIRLLVADEPSYLRDTILDCASELKTETVVVDDGEAALSAIQQFSPDVIILGTALSKVYCFELCERIRADERLSNRRIILTSMPHESNRFRRTPEYLHGADDLIEGRVEKAEVVARLREHIKAAQYNRQKRSGD